MIDDGLLEAYKILSVEKARESFWAFRKLLHPDLKLGWFQREVSGELQTFYEDLKLGLRPQLVIEAPPQHGKSTIINDFLIWMIGKDSEGGKSDLKVIYAAFSDSLSTRANRRIQRYINTEGFMEVFPKFKATTPITQNHIGFGDDGYFMNTTTGGAINGMSMSVGVIDDPVKGRAESNSATIREKTWEWFTSDFKTRFSNDGAFLCILTRWHIDDIIGRLIDIDPSLKVLRYPAIAEHDEQFRLQGEALFPEHKSLEFLNGQKSLMTSAGWNSLYQQNPTIAEGNFFKPDMIPVVDALPSGLRFVRAWDLAATANGGDYTAGVKIGYDDKARVAYIADVVRGQWGPDEVEKVLLNTSTADGKFCKVRLPQDPGQAGKAQIRSLVKLLSGFSVITDTISGDKETRASPVAAQCNVGNIYILRSAWNRAYIEELRHFPNGVNDDQVDASSDAYNHFVKKTGLLF